MRLLTALIFEQFQQPDSAAAYYELALDPARLFWVRRLDIMLVSPFAHDRLARIYTSAGRLSDARRHRALGATFARPDLELR